MQAVEIEKICSAKVRKNTEIVGLSYDSRRVKENYLFFAVKGHKTDGNIFVDELLKKFDNIVVVTENDFDDSRCIKVNDVRDCMGKIASLFYNNPTDSLNVVGITGTNGKTTTTYLLHSIFEESDIIGTTGYTIGGLNHKLENTTPESADLHKIFDLMVKNNDKYCFMEASSHAITLKRTSGIKFALKVFTNISQDHLDYYKTMENYAQAKLSFFNRKDKKVVNADDSYASTIIDKNTITYGFSKQADIYPLDYGFDIDGIKLKLNVFSKRVDIESSLIGRYNIYNIMCAVGVSVFFEKDLNSVAEGIKNCTNVPGRLEFFKKNSVYAVVDYAHTDDAMSNVLSTLKEIKKGRLIVVFGAGGDRDRTKRPKMGRVAETLADTAIVTSDNPRSENPDSIIEDILKGIEDKSHTIVEPDRQKAIEKALDMAKKNDIVAVVGKGHEDYQILKDRTIHFDDREVIKKHWRI